MAGCLLHLPEDDGVTVSGPVLRRLLERGDGDAALLYLALLRRQGTVPPRAMARELRWERPRLEQAEAALRELGLLGTEEPSAPPAPEEERAAYQPADIADALESDPEFSNLLEAVERRLGKRLSTQNQGILLGLYADRGLPADVLYLLVCHCTERVARRYGEGRIPSMKQIEKEGYLWQSRGLDTQEAAALYLKDYAARQAAMPAYLRALQLGERPPAAAEERYLSAWMEMGFSPEAAAIAYERTVAQRGALDWSYCGGILKRWHAAGLHTPEEIETGDPPRGEGRKPAARQAPAPRGAMRKYVQQLHKNREEER